MKFTTIVIMAILGLPCFSFSQNLQDKLLERAIYLQETEGDYAASTAILNSLVETFKESKDWEGLVNCHNNIAINYSYAGNFLESDSHANKAIGFVKQYGIFRDSLLAIAFDIKAENRLQQGQLDSSIYFYKKASYLFEKQELWERFAYTQIGLAVNYYYTHQIASMELYLDRATMIAEKHLTSSEEIFPIIYNLKGALYNTNGDYDKAIETAEKAGKMWAKSGENELLAICLKNLGVLHNQKADYGKAIENFQIALNLLQDFDDKSLEISEINNQLGLSQVEKGDYLKASETLLRNLQIIEKLPVDVGRDNRLWCLMLLGKNSIRTKDYTAALNYLHQALPLLSNKENDEHILFFIGQAHLELGNYKSALDTLNLSIELSREIYGDYKNMGDYAYLNIGKVYAAQNDFENALQYFQRCTEVLAFEKQNDVYQNPDPNFINLKRRYLKVLVAKANILFARYQQQSYAAADLEYTLDTYRTINQLIDLMRQEYRSEESSHFLLENTNSVYEKAITVALELNRVTGGEKYLEEAHQFAQKSKAILLLERLNSSKAKIFSKLPDTLIQKELQIKRDLDFYQKNVFETLNKSNIDSFKLAVWQRKVYDLKNDLVALNNKLENEYPDYAKLKNTPELPTIINIQNEILDTRKTYIEYFVGEEFIFIFRISKNELQVFQFEKPDEFSELITDLQNAIINPPYGSIKESLSQFAEPAHELYKILLKPVFDGHDGHLINQGLVIVPHGILGFIPFEILLTAPADKNSSSFGALDFLVKKHPIGYSYAAGLLMQRKTEEKGLARCLAFAPTYGEGNSDSGVKLQGRVTRDGESALPGAQEEVENISNYFPGDYYFGDEATEQTFKEKAPDYRLIHLAMHGFADVSNPMFSKLIFGGGTDTMEDQTLFAYEIFDLPLKADLVVLSACETGVGQFVHGEGVKSLAHSFLNAGVSAVTMSLWEAQDQATAKIMDAYYEHLSEGMSKDQALRTAKLGYLESNSSAKHPYFWAAFVTIGDVTPLEMAKSSWWIYGLGLLFMAVVVIFLLHKRSK